MSSFDGRTVLVTGGGTGIGKGCAQHFLARGASVTIAGPDRDILVVEVGSDVTNFAINDRAQTIANPTPKTWRCCCTPPAVLAVPKAWCIAMSQ
jgi:NAD(P)-dependent dehydrogenase (short-subunit alcohol dehydrogenase family)